MNNGSINIVINGQSIEVVVLRDLQIKLLKCF